VLVAIALVVLIGLLGQKLLAGKNVESALVGVKRILYILDSGFASNDRYVRYMKTWTEIERNPFLGSGVGSWAMLNGYGDVREYPHNIWLDVWFELGLIGVALLALIFWWGLQRFWPPRVWIRQHYAPLVLALFGTGFISAQFSGNYNENWFMFAMLGLLLIQPLGESAAPSNSELLEKS
jgi:O-antigen ligase